MRQRFRVPGVGYQRQPVRLAELELVGQWIVVQEDAADPVSAHGLLIVRQGTPHGVVGTVLRAGPEAGIEGVGAGDRVVYEEWAGGRWALKGDAGEDVHVLVMSVDTVLALVRE